MFTIILIGALFVVSGLLLWTHSGKEKAESEVRQLNARLTEVKTDFDNYMSPVTHESLKSFLEGKGGEIIDCEEPFVRFEYNNAVYIFDTSKLPMMKMSTGISFKGSEEEWNLLKAAANAVQDDLILVKPHWEEGSFLEFNMVIPSYNMGHYSEAFDSYVELLSLSRTNLIAKYNELHDTAANEVMNEKYFPKNPMEKVAMDLVENQKKEISAGKKKRKNLS